MCMPNEVKENEITCCKFDDKNELVTNRANHFGQNTVSPGQYLTAIRCMTLFCSAKQGILSFSFHTSTAKMAGVGLALTNVILGLGNVGAGIGFGVAEQKKMDELSTKSQTLKDAVNTAGNMYDHIYYLVAVNLDRVKKALDKLPSDMLDKLQKEITSLKPRNIKTAAKVLGNVGYATGLGAGILQIVRYFRNKKAKGEGPSDYPGGTL